MTNPASVVNDPDTDRDSRGDRSVLTELLTSRQIAELLQVPTSTVEDYARRQVLPPASNSDDTAASSAPTSRKRSSASMPSLEPIKSLVRGTAVALAFRPPTSSLPSD